MAEKAILVTVGVRGESAWPIEDRARELQELARSSGAQVEEEILCHKDKPTPDLFIGKGKFEELIVVAQEKRANVVIFNNNLTPVQLRNLEKGLQGVRVIDRTQVILDIFAKHAQSIEGKFQIELAQLGYLLPRLTGKGIELSRLGGGIATSGPGEQILEYQRRRIRDRIAKLKVKLKELERRRNTLRKKRQDALLTSIAIIGYTNAGKTTLLNQLTHSKKLVADKLFSTLDPVARSYTLPNNQKVLFLDTVGFLYNLPHGLIEAFKSTLEEVKTADILVHILDASNKMIHEQEEAVYEVLKELGAEQKLIIKALNKIDLADNPDYIKRLQKDFRDAVCISALKGEGIELLIDKISDLLTGLITEIKIEIPHNRMDLLNMIYKNGKVHYREDRSESIYIEATVPIRIKSLLNSTLSAMHKV